MTALIHEALEVWQGRCAFRRGCAISDNPYKWTPNSRNGDAKRAKWELGFNTEQATCDEPIPYRITEAGRKMLEGRK